MKKPRQPARAPSGGAGRLDERSTSLIQSALGRTLKRHSHKAGAPPGSLVHLGRRKQDRVDFTIVEFDHERFAERLAGSVDECLLPTGGPGVVWIAVGGLHDTAAIQRLGDHFGLHALIQEDILNPSQMAVCQDYGDCLFVAAKHLYHDPVDDTVLADQVSLVIGRGFVLSFQEQSGGLFEPVRERLRNPHHRIRRCGADHLGYALLDLVVDNWFVALEKLGDGIEALQAGQLVRPGSGVLGEVFRRRQELVALRKTLLPHREALKMLLDGGSDLLDEQTLPFLRDVSGHAQQVFEIVDGMRDSLQGTVELHMMAVSNRLNEVMRLLTILSTICMPLSLLAGIYGMNFAFMPELGWRYGYFAVLGTMGALAAGMLALFWRRGWL